MINNIKIEGIFEISDKKKCDLLYLITKGSISKHKELKKHINPVGIRYKPFSSIFKKKDQKKNYSFYKIDSIAIAYLCVFIRFLCDNESEHAKLIREDPLFEWEIMDDVKETLFETLTTMICWERKFLEIEIRYDDPTVIRKEI